MRFADLTFSGEVQWFHLDQKMSGCSVFAATINSLPFLRLCAVICVTPQHADRATMDGRGAIDGKFSVPYDSKACGFFFRLNRSFILFVKASSTVPA